jgi:HAD superfamily phosphoserine phosphatase-like hydrolase
MKPPIKIKAALIDFDGTLTTQSLLDWLADLAGKKAQSEQVGLQSVQKGKSPGLTPLIQRINLLKGLSVDKIHQSLAATPHYFLRTGAQDLFDFLKENNITSIVHSGNILPLLEFYQTKLGIDYLVGSKVALENGTLTGISEESYSGPDFKLQDCQAILQKLGISPQETMALGDSPADRTIFEFSQFSIAVNPRFGIEKHANYTVNEDLREVVNIITQLSS